VANCTSILPGALRVLLPAPSLQPLAPRIAVGPKPVDETAAAESVPEEPAPPDAKPVPVAPVAIPAFAAAAENLAGAEETGQRLRLWKYFAVLAAACGAIGAYLLLSPAGQESPGRASRAARQADPAVGGFGWTTEWAGDVEGSARGRQLTLYDASAGKRDYRMEFSGRIHVKSLGWVFRHADSRNYYLMKLEVLRPGTFPVVKLIRYAVVNGEEREHRQITLPFGVQVDTLHKVVLDVRGQRFTTSIQDKVVDVWTDGALKSGAVGFFHDRGDEGTIQAVRITMGGR
jgi:hypothetical protein